MRTRPIVPERCSTMKMRVVWPGAAVTYKGRARPLATRWVVMFCANAFEASAAVRPKIERRCVRESMEEPCGSVEGNQAVSDPPLRTELSLLSRSPIAGGDD